MVNLREIFEDLSKEISVRKISRTHSVCRKTVSKYKTVYDNVLETCNGDVDRALLEIMRTEFTYKHCEKTKSALTEEVTSKIDKMLEENETLRHTPGMRKLVKKRKTIYRILREEGHKISYSSVCTYIKSKDDDSKSKECFIRLKHLPGEEIEFDWGEFSLEIGGAQTKIQMAVFTLCHSNFRVAYIYTNQSILAFNDAHVRFFRELRGMPQIMIYDNMRLAVKSFKGREKELTDNIISLSDFYSFNVRLCNIRSGNEKGQVERSVDVVRQFVFSYKYKFGSFKEAEDYLRDRLKILNTTELSPATEGIVERTKVDLEAMREKNPYKYDMPCFEVESYSVDKYSTISFHGSHYSVPDHLVGEEVDVKIYATEIEIKHKGVPLARWSKAITKGSWMMDINHYLKTLGRKPGAVHQSEVLNQAPEPVRMIFETHFKDSPKQFVELLIYAKEHNISYETLGNVYASLMSSDIRHPKYEHYIAYLDPTVDRDKEIHQEEADKIGCHAENTLDGLTAIMDGGHGNDQTRA